VQLQRWLYKRIFSGSPCSLLKGKAWRLPIIIWIICCVVDHELLRLHTFCVLCACVWLYAQRLPVLSADLTFVCLKVSPHQTANKKLFLTPGRLAVSYILVANLALKSRATEDCIQTRVKL
jgi:hypothetical protein